MPAEHKLSSHQSDAAAIAGIIERNKAQLLQPGVRLVRPGWLFRDDWITDERAIVVKALPDQVAHLAGTLPKQIEGVPVQVRPENPVVRLAHADRARYAAVVTGARVEFRQPTFAGAVAGPAADETHPNLPHAAPAPQAAKSQIPYTAPAASVATLDAVEEPMSLTLHASPDAGWAQLQAFLDAVESELAISMYDFTSGHILDAMTAAIKGKKLSLTLDHPAPDPSRDQTDDQTMSALQAAGAASFNFAWALTNPDVHAPVWIFPTAYHIKVAVRDGKAFWLSSGNLNNSNQPVIDLTNPTAAQAIAKKSDRDWHVIGDSPGLIHTFAGFLKNDYTVAHQQETAAAAIARATNAAQQPAIEASLLPQVAAKRTVTFFPPKTITGKIRVQPLLTPDAGSYQPHIKALILSAKKKFYMQTQYIHTSDAAADAPHMELIAAVVDRIKAGLDVKLITSTFETKDWLEKLTEAGVDVATVLRTQPGVHNKGMVVDDVAAVVSSQNWSAEGTLRNRDAGVIIYSVDAAAYFESIFLHDWNNLASATAAE